MDQTEEYRTLVKSLLSETRTFILQHSREERELWCAFDDEQGQYLLLNTGWRNLKWSTTIRQTLPEMRGKIRPELLDVTVELLVTHRAGLRNGPEKGWGVTRDTPSAARYLYVQNLLDSPKVAEPGEKSSYAPGVEVIGIMLERLTGKTLEKLFKEEVFDRFDMKSCVLGDPYIWEKNPDVPWGYSDGRKIKAKDKPIGPAYACGAVFGTVEDLARWYSTLASGLNRGGEDLSRQVYTDAFFVPKGSHHTRAGLGDSGNGRFYHNGGTSRGHIQGMVNVKREKVIVVSSNSCNSEYFLPGLWKRCIDWVS